MATMIVPLPDPMKDWVDAQITNSAYASSEVMELRKPSMRSRYVREDYKIWTNKLSLIKDCDILSNAGHRP